MDSGGWSEIHVMDFPDLRPEQIQLAVFAWSGFTGLRMSTLFVKSLYGPQEIIHRLQAGIGPGIGDADFPSICSATAEAEFFLEITLRMLDCPRDGLVAVLVSAPCHA